MKWGLEQALQLSSIRRVTVKKFGGRTGIHPAFGKTLPLLLRSRRAHTSDWVLPHRYPDGSCVYGVIRCRTPTNRSVGCRCQPEHTDGEPNINTRQTRSCLRSVRQSSSVSCMDPEGAALAWNRTGSADVTAMLTHARVTLINSQHPGKAVKMGRSVEEVFWKFYRECIVFPLLSTRV